MGALAKLKEQQQTQLAEEAKTALSSTSSSSALRISLESILKQFKSIYEETKSSLPKEVLQQHWIRAKSDPNAWATIREHFPRVEFDTEVLETILNCKGQIEALLSLEARKDQPQEERLKLSKQRRAA